MGKEGRSGYEKRGIMRKSRFSANRRMKQDGENELSSYGTPRFPLDQREKKKRRDRKKEDSRRNGAKMRKRKGKSLLCVQGARRIGGKMKSCFIIKCTSGCHLGKMGKGEGIKKIKTLH